MVVISRHHRKARGLPQFLARWGECVGSRPVPGGAQESGVLGADVPEAVPGKDRPPAGSFLSFSCFSFPSRLARRLCAQMCTSRYVFRKKTPNSSTYFLHLRQLGQVISAAALWSHCL